ncbi:dihydrodipicolinate synthase family protein [Sphingomonas sp. CFBP 13728]|uniref:dihydrodipicolinate synthase family protein n=1 Tax=Sphingomonas sp. CFBP 13728 TaxID=2775294 RepID=UPI00177E20AD|nr:dihydrodipicolinate synthase family protein [Sphingomonas sp. CFBP 13728]MBD8621153.1 dihydrodipicolinate synthase family protein [Sphingomonas sp. CFBP 13728]
MATEAEGRLRQALRGVSGILVTPFDPDDAIAPLRLAPVVDRAVKAGVSVLVANGNTGEFYALTTGEAEAMVHATSELIDGRVPLVAGVGRGIGDALALTRASRKAGASALMIHQPPDPFVAPRGVVAYVSRIVDEAQGLPALLYLRDDGIGLDAIVDLCGIPGVVGVKWACPTPLKLADAIRATDPRLVWSGGLAETWAPAFYAVGARGFTSGLINVWPERSVAISIALESGDYVQARSLIEGIVGFEVLRSEERNGANVSVVKAALQILGDDCGSPRVPAAWPLPDDTWRALRQLLEEIPASASAGLPTVR